MIMNMEWGMVFKLGGLLHFSILTASALTPKALDWNQHLSKLPLLLRQLFWVYGGFIVLVIVGFGALSWVHAEELAEGGPLARWFCGFVSLFWLARLGVQLFVFDAKPYLTFWLYRYGYHSLTGVFVALSAIYAWAAVGPAR